jgi:26S proteasome regulatory subunit N1
MKHNAEHEAVDLLLEVGLIETIVPHTDEANHSRVCLYLTQCAGLLQEPDDTLVLKVTFDIYKKFQQWPLALRIALRLNDVNYVKEAYTSATDE